MGYRNFKLLDMQGIRNGALLHAIYRGHSVNTGEPHNYCVPLELAETLFGKNAKYHMMEVSQVLNQPMGCEFKGKDYVSVTGWNIMKYYRASEIFRSEVEEHDTGECTEHQSNSVSNKKKKVR